MAMQLLTRTRRRYVVPIGVAAMTAAAMAIPQLAIGQSNPALPARTAAQLLADLEHTSVPNFSGTVVATSRLGLPSLSDAGLSGLTDPGTGLVGQVTTLLTGSHTVQLAYGGPNRQRVAIFLDDLSETDIVHNGADVWTYSSTDNSVSHTVRKPQANTSADTKKSRRSNGLPPIANAVSPQQAAEHALAAIDPSTAVSVDRTARVAGRAAYQLVLQPRSSDSLIGSVRIAIDARTSMPLRVQIWPRAAAASPALQVGFTSLKIATPAASTFTFTAPPGAVMKSGPFAVNPRILGTPRRLGGLLKHAAKRAPAGLQVPAGTQPMPAAPKVSATSGPAHPAFRTIGKDWLQVLVGAAPTAPVSQQTGPTPGQQLTTAIDRLATPVAQGRLLQTMLVSVLITNDGRIFLGAVTSSYLEGLAAQGVHA